MAGLDPATQPKKESYRAQMHADWMTGSEAGHGGGDYPS
jgi:hypothetical protein